MWAQIALAVSGVPFFFVLSQMNPDRCTNTTWSENTGGSCNFEHNHCGWDDSDQGDDLNWERVDRFHLGQNSYIRANMTGVSAGSVARLHSPWLCATGPETTRLRSLTFRYSVQKSDRCRVAVVVATKHGHRKEVWESVEGTGVSFSDRIGPIYLQCSRLSFQIIFVGQKLTSEPCGNLFDEIDIDDIIVRDVIVTPTEHHDCSSFPNPLEGEGKLDAGVVLSVVLFIVAVVVIAVVVAWILWRRKKRTLIRKATVHELQTKPRSMTNCTYMTTDSDCLNTTGSDRGTNSLADVTTTATTITPHADARDDATGDVTQDSPGEAANIYSVPEDYSIPATQTSSPGALAHNVPRVVPAHQDSSGDSSLTPSAAPLSRDGSSISRYNRLVLHGSQSQLLPHNNNNPSSSSSSQNGHTYDRLADINQGTSLYTELSTTTTTEDNSGSSVQKNGVVTRGGEGSELRSSFEGEKDEEGCSIMENEYMDMSQGTMSQVFVEDAEYQNTPL